MRFAPLARGLDPCSYGIPGTIALLCGLTVIGDTLAYLFSVPIPGSAIGMSLLVGLFATRGGPDEASVKVFDAATPYLPMFFVPAAVGVIARAEVVAAAWVELGFAVILGTAMTIAITGHIAQALLRRPVSEGDT